MIFVLMCGLCILSFVATKFVSIPHMVRENFFLGIAGVNDIYLKIGLGPI